MEKKSKRAEWIILTIAIIGGLWVYGSYHLNERPVVSTKSEAYESNQEDWSYIADPVERKIKEEAGRFVRAGTLGSWERERFEYFVKYLHRMTVGGKDDVDRVSLILSEIYTRWLDARNRCGRTDLSLFLFTWMVARAAERDGFSKMPLSRLTDIADRARWEACRP